MQPRIYTYKITFKGMPFWYWGVHKEEKYGECYFGTPVTRKWFWEFYEPEIQILEFFPYTDEGWEEACKVEKRLIRPDLNEPYCLNENVGGYVSLEVLRKVAAASHAEKDADGKSLLGKKAGAALNAEKDVEGKSVNAKKGAAAVHAEKDENGKSVNAKKGAAALNAVKDERGKSVNAVRGGAAAKLVCQKKVELICIMEGRTFLFGSLSDACRSLDLNLGNLSQVCNGKRESTKGYTARYI